MVELLSQLSNALDRRLSRGISMYDADAVYLNELLHDRNIFHMNVYL